MKLFTQQKFKLLYPLICLIVTIVLLISSALAWFSIYQNRQGDTKALTIQEPPILYILDSDAMDMTQLSLSGLEIGVTKRLVFCVSSVFPVESDSQGFKSAFSLQLAYTNNLSANYTIYNANIENQAGNDTVEYISQSGSINYFTPDDSPLTGVNVSESGNLLAYSNGDENVQEKNLATYMKYSYSDNATSPNSNLIFSDEDETKTGTQSKLNCRYFILEITWGNTSGIDSKETDMIYIIAKSGS